MTSLFCVGFELGRKIEFGVLVIDGLVVRGCGGEVGDPLVLKVQNPDGYQSDMDAA